MNWDKTWGNATHITLHVFLSGVLKWSPSKIYNYTQKIILCSCIICFLNAIAIVIDSAKSTSVRITHIEASTECISQFSHSFFNGAYYQTFGFLIDEKCEKQFSMVLTGFSLTMKETEHLFFIIMNHLYCLFCELIICLVNLSIGLLVFFFFKQFPATL